MSNVFKVIAKGASAFPKKGPRPSNMKQPTAEGRFEQHFNRMDIIEDSVEGYGGAFRAGGKARGGITWPRTDRFGVTRVYRGDASTRMAAADIASHSRAKVQKAKRAAMRKRVKALARKRELEAKGKSGAN